MKTCALLVADEALMLKGALVLAMVAKMEGVLDNTPGAVVALAELAGRLKGMLARSVPAKAASAPQVLLIGLLRELLLQKEAPLIVPQMVLVDDF